MVFIKVILGLYYFLSLLNLCLRSSPEILGHLYHYYFKSFSGKLPISISLGCSCGFLSCSFIWNIFLCHLIFPNFLCGLLFTGCRIIASLAFGVCPLAGEVGTGACEVSGGQDWSLPTGGWSWVLFLLWAGPCQGVPLEVARCSGSLFVMGGAVFPILLVVWSEAF